MGRVLVMVGSDLRQQVLDRSIFIFGLAVPLALMWVFSLIFAPLAQDLEPVTVAVSGPAEDPLTGTLAETLDGLDDAVDVTVVEADAADVPTLLADGEIGAGVLVPDGFSAALAAGDAPQVRVRLPESPGLEGEVVTAVVDGVLRQFTATARTAAAAEELGGQPQEVDAVLAEDAATGPSVRWAQGETADEQLSARESIVAGQAGFFLLFTVGFGVLGLVVEREWGTLARLLSMPIPSWWVPLSKGLSSWVLGVVATGVLLLAGSLLFDDVHLGSPAVIAVLLLAVVAAATSIMFVIAKVTRTAEQAGVAQTIVAITLGMSGGAFFRVSSEGVLGTVLQLNPVTALGRGLGITAGGGGVVDLAPVLAATGLMCVAMTALAVLVPGRRDVL
ncbi:ABC transporter permease [uncultured Serinicoccus sp.]|uniref:ABC transporter permease n=1 Tax=uncultured Serinicoccus sp. TaxID=735514 RepID=UPI002628467B|nr:ABC transporter permease [uncultured Serinicoccus sp.]